MDIVVGIIIGMLSILVFTSAVIVRAVMDILELIEFRCNMLEQILREYFRGKDDDGR